MGSLSAACVRMGFTFDPDGGWHARAEAMYEKALSIDSRLPEGRCLKGLLLWTPRRSFDHAGAIREFLGALAGSPNLADTHEMLGLVLLHLAMFDEADRHLAQALAIDPANIQGEIHQGWSEYLQGRYRESLEMAEAASRKSPSSWGSYHVGALPDPARGSRRRRADRRRLGPVSRTRTGSSCSIPCAA